MYVKFYKKLMKNKIKFSKLKLMMKKWKRFNQKEKKIIK